MTESLSDRQQFIEDVGIMFEDLGMGRTPGRIIAALMISEPPYKTMQELADLLQMSKGSISTGLNMLQQAGFTNKMSVPGKRADYYKINHEFWEDTVVKRNKATQQFKTLIKRAFQFIEDDEYPDRRQTLKEMYAMYNFMELKVEELIEEWNKILEEDEYHKYLDLNHEG